MKKLALISAALCAVGSYVSVIDAASTDVNLKLTVAAGDVALDVTGPEEEVAITANPSDDGTYKAGDINYTNVDFAGIRLKTNRAMDGNTLTVRGQSDDDANSKFRLANGTDDYQGPQYIPYQLQYGNNVIAVNDGDNTDTIADGINAEADGNIDFKLNFGEGGESLGELVANEEYRDTLTFTFSPPEA